MCSSDLEITEIQIGKEDVKLPLFADDMIPYIENPKDATGKLLEPINEFVNVAEYKINAQKFLAFLYTNNEKSEKEIKEIQIRKEEVKLSLLADDMIPYIENPKDATRKLLELINEFGKVAGYKINA